MRVAASADLHCRVDGGEEIRRMLEDVGREADVLLLGGDLTNLGLVEEMAVLLEVLDAVPVPKIAVTGNHDHESGHVEELVAMMRGAGISVLEGEAVELDGVGFVGTKGFCGGFGIRRLMSFGEASIKSFVDEAQSEAAALEKALQAVRTRRKVAVLHYSPIAATLEGEPPEIYPFLGYSLLADALDRHAADVAIHGHAHHGSPTGTTDGGIPVLNVSRYVVGRQTGKDYVIFEVGER